MRTRLFNLAATISAIVFVASIVAWIAASRLNPQTQRFAVPGGYLSFGTFFHVPSLALLNDGRNGPYHGSITGIAGDPNGPRRTALDAAGIYFRHFRWPDGHVLWTLLVSVYYPIAISGPLPILWLLRRRNRRRGGRGFEVVAGMPPA